MTDSSTNDQADRPKKQKKKNLAFPPEIWNAAKDIATRLNETERNALWLIARTIETIGHEKADAIVDETMKVEADGGLMTNKGDRRRTTGGVYFYLLKGKLTYEERGRIFFAKSRKKKQQEQAQKADAPSAKSQTADENGTESAIPAGMPSEDAKKLRALYQAADQFRQKIADAEASSKKASLLQKLLNNTEKQINALVGEYNKT